MFIIRIAKKSDKEELLNSLLLFLIQHEEEQLHWQVILENLLKRSHLTLGQLETIPFQLLGLHYIDEHLLHLNLVLVSHDKTSVLLCNHLFHLRDIFENPIIDMLLLIES